ncbi:hypothetical protein BDW_03655 [Bdellovibrio bacteriovorus W]|nr:hypothetical protein BDW_03655 [Bdellovibrio bacteriovorus W]
MKTDMEVKKILLNDWDPIGIKNNPNAKAEYDQYALRIVGMLYSGTTRTELAKYLDSVVTDDFGLSANKSLSHTVSEKLMAVNLDKLKNK